MKKKINYKNTINLPKINFPMKANLKEKEIFILKKWEKNNLYKKINKHKKKTFLIHDGPPYANKNIHIGHALNKILKDIILKYKILMNYSINYIPGWDCHGLPIELEIQKKHKLPNKKNIFKINNFKKKCLTYVKKQIIKQKKDFIRLGVIAEWKKPYYTMNYKIIANTIQILQNIIKLKLLKRKKKPINWCIKCRSSLSDTEIEYHNKISNTAYIIFKLIKEKKITEKIKIKENIKKINLIIWTTTIWTIPANCAISIHPELKYSLLKEKKNIYIILKNKKKEIFKKINKQYKEIKTIKGEKLKSLYAYHPISKIKIPIILDKNINKKTGTGIIHIASQYGEEDYILSQKYNLNNLSIINNKGKFKKYKYIKNIEGLNIKEGEKYILKKLEKNKKILFTEKIIHNYPYCWRHKKPIIYKSTSQWFITINKEIKNNVLKEIKLIKWIPKWGYKKIKKMIKERPDWCISRQRYWGVPITIFINKKTKKIHPKTIKLMNIFILKIKKYGPQYWLNLNPKNIIKNHNKYKKILDVLDVWFESGSTILTILDQTNTKKKNIDLILEGSDQYRGWFMSSLIISCIIKKYFPCKTIISHGFVVDAKGKKMSKSLDNYIKPQYIINKYGADILRLWVASTNYIKDINISDEILLRITDIYRKIRNTIKFLISNLDDFNPEKEKINIKNMILIDKWIIYKTNKTQNIIIKLYQNFKFSKLIKLINHFCINNLSSIYLDIIKDRKYIIKKNTTPYYSVLTTLWILIESISKWIAPILSFTADEIWNYIPRKNKKKNIFQETWFNLSPYIEKTKIISSKIWKKLILIKQDINLKIEKLRLNKIINSSLETNIYIYTKKNFYKKIKFLKNELKFFFLTSEINLKIIKNINNKKFYIIKCFKHKGIKCYRCWHYIYKNQLSKNKIYPNICTRCLINIIGNGETRKFI